MKKTTLSLLLLLTMSIVKAQDQQEKVTLEKTIVSLNLLAPGISIEAAIAEQQSFYFNAALSIYFRSETFNGRTTSEFSTSPYLMGQYRSYYNLDKRQLLGRKTAYNSGNYWGIMVAHQGKPFSKSENLSFLEDEPITVLGPVWGIQRNGIVSFGLSLGVGLHIRPSATEGGLISSFNLGLNLSKIFK